MLFIGVRYVIGGERLNLSLQSLVRLLFALGVLVCGFRCCTE